MPHPFITIASSAVATLTVATAKINTIYIVGTKGTEGTVAANTITQVNTSTDFNTLIGATSLSSPSFRFMRSIDSAVPIFFVNGLATGGSPTLKDHLIAGAALIGKNLQLNPGIIVCPELAGLTVSAEVVATYNALQNLVSNPLLSWQYFHNFTLAANTLALVTAERSLLTSPDGHSAGFFGYGKDSDNNQIPLSVASAARMTLLNRTRRGYFAPAAFQDPIPFKSVDAGYQPRFEIGVNELSTLVDNGINCIYKDGANFTICGTRTLATTQSFRHLNTRYASNDLFSRTSQVLKPYLFLPIDQPNNVNAVLPDIGSAESSVNADILSTLIDLLNQFKNDGMFSQPFPLDDGTLPPIYDIVPAKLANGNLSLTIGAYIISSRERIELNFVKRN